MSDLRHSLKQDPSPHHGATADPGDEGRASLIGTQFEVQIGKIEADRRELEGQVEQLRAFEREYRTRLRAYLELQLRELDAPGSTPQVEGAPSRPPIGPGVAPSGSGPGGPAGTGPGGPARPDEASPFNAGPAPDGGEPADASVDGEGSPAPEGS